MKDDDGPRERREQRRKEKLGSNNPLCASCGEDDWRCLQLSDRDGELTLCANCRWRKQCRKGKSPSNILRCAVCGHPQCIELHHLAGRKRDARVIPLCANDHCRVTDDQNDHPKSSLGVDPMLDKVGHFLLNLADVLKLIIDWLYEFGAALIERARTAGDAKPSAS